MAGYSMYVIDLEEGSVRGVNDVDEVKSSGILESDSFIVLHPQSGVFFQGSTEETKVEQFISGDEEDKFFEDEEDDED